MAYQRFSLGLIVAKNTGSQLVGKVLAAGTTLLVTIVLAQRFGVSGFGDVTKVLTYISLFYLVADFGLNAAFLRKPDDAQNFGILLTARLLLGGLLLFASLAFLSFLPQGETQGYTYVVRMGIILFSPAIVFQAIITTANAVFQKHLRYDLAAVAIAVGSITTVISLWIIVPLHFGAIITAITPLLLGAFTTAAVSIFLIKRLDSSLLFSFPIRRVIPFFISALPLGIMLVCNLIYSHVDNFILTLTRSTHEVGIYGMAYKAFELVLVFPTFFMNSSYPLLLKAVNNKSVAINSDFIHIIKRLFYFLLLASLTMIILVWVTAPSLRYIHDGFALSATPLKILSLSFPFFFISALVMWSLITLKKNRWLVIIYSAAMFINIALTIWLVPQHGYIAAAWITVVSEGFVLLTSGAILISFLKKTFVVK